MSWQPPPAPYPPPGPQANGKATASLVLGICGLVLCPLVCAVLALVFGYQARTEIDASHGMQTGRGLAVAGIVLGWVGLALVVLALLFLGAVLDALRDTVELESAWRPA